MSSVKAPDAKRALPTTTPSPPVVAKDDLRIPDNYVQWVLKNQRARPPITLDNWWRELNYLTCVILTVTPAIAVWGVRHVHLRWETFLWSVVYYFITALGITAGYHRLWSHRSYNASRPLQYFLVMAGAGAVQGSVRWWCRGHRAHHRYTDTELDPYNAKRGFLWSHIGWLLLKPRRKPGVADVSDLSKGEVPRWQHRWYLQLIIICGWAVPTLVAGFGWGDWWGGFVYAGAARLTFVHHSTFCINSVAHFLGDQPFDDKLTPCNSAITALLTAGEGYHNFHHQFPGDYRNAVRWYQYDPTKWFIWACSKVGLASQLKTFPDNEVRKGELAMQLKRLREAQDGLQFAPAPEELPVVSWESFQEQAQKRALVLVAGFIHDVSAFVDEHPGGRHLLAKAIGEDATTAFFGGVYEHSNAAHNLLSMMRVGVLHGGMETVQDDKVVPPGQRLRVARVGELCTPYASSSAWSEEEGILG